MKQKTCGATSLPKRQQLSVCSGSAVELPDGVEILKDVRAGQGIGDADYTFGKVHPFGDQVLMPKEEGGGKGEGRHRCLRKPTGEEKGKTRTFAAHPRLCSGFPARGLDD